MEHIDFVTKYDCQIQYQYSFDGKKKTYYPIISNLHFSNGDISLLEFSKYPQIDFHSCVLTNVTLKLDKIRDLNFQNCVIQQLVLELNEFYGTLGFANSDLSISSMVTSRSPKILAIVESVIFGMKDPGLQGFSTLHTCALIYSRLDFLSLDSFLSQISCEQLLLTEIEPYLPIELNIPSTLVSLKLKNMWLQSILMRDNNNLEALHLDTVEFSSIIGFFETLNKLQKLKELAIITSNLKSLTDLQLDNLEKLQVDYDIQLGEKLLARLKLGDIELIRI